MSDPVAHHPVEDAVGASDPPADTVGIQLIAAENALQEQACQMANIQASIDNVSKIVSLLAETQKEENIPQSSETGVRSRICPSEPPDFDGTREKGQAFLTQPDANLRESAAKVTAGYTPGGIPGKSVLTTCKSSEYKICGNPLV